MPRGQSEPLELLHLRRAFGLGVFTGVQFDDGGAAVGGSVDLLDDPDR